MTDIKYLVDDNGPEEIVVQKVFCRKCHDYVLLTPDKASKINDSNFTCENCTLPPGVHRVVKLQEQCGGCGKILGKDRMCYCPPKKSGTKLIMDPKNAWLRDRKDPRLKRIEEQIEEGKLNSQLRQRFYSAKKEDLERQKRIDSNLQKIADALTKKEEQPKPKEVNHSAIS